MTPINLPKHIAIIMDGNGRWAKKRFLPRIAGHRAGVEAARKAVKFCAQQQIEVLSLFAFSSENWKRPPQEVQHLMDLFLTGLQREVPMLHEHNVQLRFIGKRCHFTEALNKQIAEVEALTLVNTGMKLIIAVDYGGKWDICQAVQLIAKQVANKELDYTAIDETQIAKHLSFADLPDPDLFIRTSGEVRISNFMLWQLAYSELYFTNTLWPDFDVAELERAIGAYSQRERRFGDSQVQASKDKIC